MMKVIKPGIDVFLTRYIESIKGKRIGLITNPTGVDAGFISTIDHLHSCKAFEIIALFGPEHGLRGDFFAGEHVGNEIDPATGIRIFSLYGDCLKPTREMLKNIDNLVYDIQDTGCRGYTFIYTMAYCMQAAAESGKKFVVLDRPNPLGGNLIDGNVLNPEFSSFVGLYPIPYCYGMTPGELARYFNTEFEINCELEVIPMEGWKRMMMYRDTGLPWIPASMHIPRAETAFYSAITGILGELPTLSIGIGYTLPFEVVGAPWIDGNGLAKELNNRNLPGVFFRPLAYEPRYFTFSNKKIQGVQIHITDYHTIKPVEACIHIMESIQKLYPDEKFLEPDDTERYEMFNNVMGTDAVARDITSGKKAGEIIASWKTDVEEYIKNA